LLPDFHHGDCIPELADCETGPDIDWAVGAFTSDIKEAAHVSAAEALQLVTRMSATFEPYGCGCHFEPVRPRDAFVDLRMRMLRKTEWGPQIYATYDPADLDRIFQPAKPIQWSPLRPFMHVPDAFLALIDMSADGASVEFSDPAIIRWRGRCPNVDEDNHDSTCDCLPNAMRSAPFPILIHVFARKDADAKFIYLTVDEGRLSLDRWNGAMLTAKWAGDHGIIDVNRFVGGKEHRQFKYCVNPDYTGDRGSWLPLTDENVPAISLIPRNEMIALVKEFYRNDGALPTPERWVDDLYAVMRSEDESE
jgi:hypothetical protein